MSALQVQLDAEARRLLWRCRRGMKELDVLLERFAGAHLAVATRDERAVFARFLELPDPLLADYLLGEATPLEPDLVRLVSSIAAAAKPSAIIEPTPPSDNC